MPKKVITLRMADIGKKTGQWLADLIREQNVDVVFGEKSEALVCYGWGIKDYTGYVLNAKAGTFNNLQQITRLQESGINTVPLVKDLKRADWSKIQFPLLARSVAHDGGGKDIMPVFQGEEIEWRQAAGASYFTQYIPRESEYRLWVFRRRIQACYQKEMTKPEKYIKIGCNYEDGFEHKYIPSNTVPTVLHELAAKSVFSLGLDFGGVDILIGKDKKPYVLEVNTASGANGPNAVGLTKLAASISSWVANDFPKQQSKYTGVENA
jgi:hypothetical protein